MEPEITYFYFDYELTMKCKCGRILKARGTNYTNKIKCTCGIVYEMIPRIVKK